MFGCKSSACSVVLAFVAAILVSSLGSSRLEAAPARGPVFVCQNSVCILHPAAFDTDGDGFSDIDERLAGTDPRNAKSHPTVLKMVQTWQRGVPGLRDHNFREVIVLPTTTPDGRPIGRSPVPGLPGRKDAITALGLDNAFLSTGDASNGLRVMLDLRTPTKSAPAGMRVSGIDVRLISDDSDLYSVSHSEEGGEVTEWFDKKTGEKVGQDTTVKGEGEGACTTYQSCNKDSCVSTTSCPRGTVMTDPDADPGIPQSGAVLVATPEQMKAYDRKRGTNTTFGSTGVTRDPSALPPTNSKSPIILINPDDDSIWLSTQPTSGVPSNFNRSGGNINCGRPDGPQRPGGSTGC